MGHSHGIIYFSSDVEKSFVFIRILHCVVLKDRPGAPAISSRGAVPGPLPKQFEQDFFWYKRHCWQPMSSFSSIFIIQLLICFFITGSIYALNVYHEYLFPIASHSQFERSVIPSYSKMYRYTNSTSILKDMRDYAFPDHPKFVLPYQIEYHFKNYQTFLETNTSAPYIIFKPTVHGIGNKMDGLISTLFIAMTTNHRLASIVYFFLFISSM